MVCFILKRKNELIIAMSILNGATFVTCAQTFVGAIAPCLACVAHHMVQEDTVWCVIQS